MWGMPAAAFAAVAAVERGIGRDELLGDVGVDGRPGVLAHGCCALALLMSQREELLLDCGGNGRMAPELKSVTRAVRSTKPRNIQVEGHLECRAAPPHGHAPAEAAAGAGRGGVRRRWRRRARSHPELAALKSSSR